LNDFCAHNLVAKLVSFIIFLLNLEILIKKTGNGGQKNGRYTGALVSVFTGASTLFSMMYTKRDLTMCVGRAAPGCHSGGCVIKSSCERTFLSNTSFRIRNYKLVQSKV
jgi:hypothetical protein